MRVRLLWRKRDYRKKQLRSYKIRQLFSRPLDNEEASDPSKWQRPSHRTYYIKRAGPLNGYRATRSLFPRFCGNSSVSQIFYILEFWNIFLLNDIFRGLSSTRQSGYLTTQTIKKNLIGTRQSFQYLCNHTRLWYEIVPLKPQIN